MTDAMIPTPRKPTEAELTNVPSPAQPDRDTAAPEQRQWGGRVRGFLQRTFNFFALYMLSIGPMFWVWYNGRYVDNPSFVAAFYEPLLRMGDWIPPLGRWLNWYVNWWIG